MRRLLVLLICSISMAAAEAQVRVVKSSGKSTIDLSGLSVDSSSSGCPIFRRTLESNLLKSGWFALAAAGRGEYYVSGSVEQSRDNIVVKCYVHETGSRRSVLSKAYRTAASEPRRLAHQVSDEIVEAITGQKGMASGRLVVVGNRSGVKELYLCDYDGGGLVQLTNDRKIGLAPKWGPDGNKIIYTSYLKGYPDAYLIDVSAGTRERIAGYPGLNMGGEISPDGKSVALILSKDGNPDLYVKDLRSGGLFRLTKTPRGAEASPSWSPDGNRIVYVSDTSGSPQLYVISRQGGQARRLTGRNSENVAPDWGVNGLIAFSTRVGGRYHVCVMNPDTMEYRQISTGGADYEDPCWAPDGRHIACSRSVQYRSAIYLLDTMGDSPVALLEIQGDWYSPSWSPR